MMRPPLAPPGPKSGGVGAPLPPGSKAYVYRLLFRPLYQFISYIIFLIVVYLYFISYIFFKDCCSFCRGEDEEDPVQTPDERRFTDDPPEYSACVNPAFISDNPTQTQATIKDIPPSYSSVLSGDFIVMHPGQLSTMHEPQPTGTHNGLTSSQNSVSASLNNSVISPEIEVSVIPEAQRSMQTRNNVPNSGDQRENQEQEHGMTSAVTLAPSRGTERHEQSESDLPGSGSDRGGSDLPGSGSDRGGSDLPVSGLGRGGSDLPVPTISGTLTNQTQFTNPQQTSTCV